MIITGCNNKKNKSEFPDSFSESDEQIVYSSFVKANLYEDEEEIGQEVDLDVKEAGSIVHFHDGTIYSSYYANNGLYVVRNESGRIGFYSSIINKMVVECRFEPEWTIYHVYTHSYFGFILNIKYEDKFITTDAFGNKLCDYEVTFIDGAIINQKPYLIINNSYYYEYDSTGKATSISSLPAQEILPEEDEYEGPSLNDLYSEGRYDLDDYGYPGYSISVAETGYIVVFNNNQVVSIFYVDINTYNLKGLVGKVLVFQRETQTMDEAEKYSFIRNGSKWDLDTLLVNFETGKKTQKDFPYVIEGIVPLKTTTTESDKRYSYIVFKQINDNSLLTESVGRIIDEGFVLHDDVSGMGINSFIELSNGNFYNLATKFIYNSSMTPITSLMGCNPVYHEELHIFTGTLDNSKGIIDENGVVKGEFRYTNIYTAHCPGNGSIIVSNANGAYRLDYTNGNTSFIGEGLTVLNNNLFKTSNNVFFTSDENIFQLEDTYVITYNSVPYLNGSYAYVLNGTNLADGDFITKTVYYGDLNTNLVDSSIKGTEKTNSYLSGLNLEQAVNLKLGKNSVHTVQTNQYGYAKYYTVEAGYYNFYHNYDAISIFKDCGDGYREAVQFTTGMGDSKGDIFYDNRVTCFLEAGIEYYVEITQNTDSQLHNIYLEQHTGSSSQYPLKLKTDFNKTTIRPNNNVSNYYISFTSEYLRKYTVSLGSGYQGSLSISQVYVNEQAVTNGQFILGGGRTVSVRVQFSGPVTEEIPLEISNTSVVLQLGKNQEDPYVLSYGSQNPYTDISYDSANPYYYVAFFAPYGGIYNFSFSFDKSIGNSSEFSVYSATGSNTYVLDPSTDPYVSNISIPENGCIIFKMQIQENGGENTLLSYCNVSSSTGASYENPSSWSSSWYMNSDAPRFMMISSGYSYDCQAIYSHSSTDATISYIDNKGAHYIAPSQETKIYVSGSGYAVLRAESSNYGNYIYHSRSFYYADAYTLDAGLNNVDLDSEEVRYLTFTNENNDAIDVSVTITSDDYIYYRYSYGGGIYQVYESYSGGYSPVSINSFTLNPGKKLHLVLYNQSTYDRSYDIDVNIFNYHIVSIGNWSSYDTDAWSTNYYSTTMDMVVTQSSYIDIGYLIVANNYYYDYTSTLIIKVNGQAIVNKVVTYQNNMSDMVHIQLYVTAGTSLSFQHYNSIGSSGYSTARVALTFLP